MLILIAALVVSDPNALVGSFPERTWTDSTGKHTFRAALVFDEKRGLLLKAQNGTEHQLNVTDISQPDQEYISDCCRVLRKKKLPVIRTKPREPAAEVDEYAYRSFSEQAANVTNNMRGVTQTKREQDDLRSLEFMLREYNQAVNAKNWSAADRVRAKMEVAMSRGGAVAADAGRRVAAQKRADEERRHEEEMRQRERHHRDRMNQPVIVIRPF